MIRNKTIILPITCKVAVTLSFPAELVKVQIKSPVLFSVELVITRVALATPVKPTFSRNVLPSFRLHAAVAESVDDLHVNSTFSPTASWTFASGVITA